MRARSVNHNIRGTTEGEDDFEILDCDLSVRLKSADDVPEVLPKDGLDLPSISNSVPHDAFELAQGVGDDLSPAASSAVGDISKLTQKVGVELHPIPGSTGQILLSVRPPEKPVGGLLHTPCDIVLVIDVSGSMNAVAELPDQAGLDKKESSGLNVLDLVKHASRTVISKLDDGDRLAVVTFSSTAQTIQGLLPMTQAEKTSTWRRIETLHHAGSTNLWGGIKAGLDVFESTDTIGNTQRMFILTDGAPNHLCPAQGYVKKLRPILSKLQEERGTAPTLSTFGFGYYLRSGLLRSIAEVGRGNYAFIPDSGMIGTIFVHAVANLFSTFASTTELILECSNPRAKIRFPSYLDAESSIKHAARRSLDLGSLQYGQTRDIIIKVDDAFPQDRLEAWVTCRVPKKSRQQWVTSCNIGASSNISQAIYDYHLARHRVCEFLDSLSTKNQNEEHISLTAQQIPAKCQGFDALVASIEGYVTKAATSIVQVDKADLEALLCDLKRPDHAAEDAHGAGQIALALRTDTARDSAPNSTPPDNHHPWLSYYTRWGVHYLPSILHAHMLQTCVSFKDPGPLRYGVHSPLFIKCRDDLDDAFDKLPAPSPSLKNKPVPGTQQGHHTWGRVTPVTSVDMSRYNRYGSVCFAGSCGVRSADREGSIGSTIKLYDLKVRESVWTRAGARMVKEIVQTDVRFVGLGSQLMCNIGDLETGLWVTPWHPVFWNGRWTFPSDVVNETKRSMTEFHGGYIYSLLLEMDDDPNAHVVEVGGIECVTLGHGLTGGDTKDDPRNHSFFGNYGKVAASLETLEMDDRGRRISGGIARQESRGEVVACEFVRPILPLTSPSARTDTTKSAYRL